MDHAKQKKIDGDVKGDKMAKNTDTECYDLTVEDEIFLRRSSIARTPPGRYRVNSLPEAWKMRAGKSKRKESSDEETTEEDREAEQANKRKKEEMESNVELDRALAEVKALIKKMGATARKLKTLVAENVNTKVEIKKTVAVADTQAEALDKKFQKWEVLSKAHKGEEMMKTTEKKEFGTQTEAVETVRKERKQLQEETKAKIIEAVRKGGTYEDYLRIGNLKWDNDVFKTAEETREDIMGLPRGWDLAVLTAVDLNHETGAARMFAARFQSVELLKDQEAAVGEVAYLTATVAVEGKNGDTREWERLIMYGMAAEKTGDTWNDRDTFKCVTSIRQLAERKQRYKVAIAGTDMGHDTALKKMIEFVFSGSEIEVRLVIDPSKARGVSEKSTERQRTNRQVAQEKGPRQRDQAVLVKVEEGKSYADLLRQVKAKVDLQGVGIKISNVRKTRQGDILVAVRKADGIDAPETLRKAIAEGVPGAKTEVLRGGTATVYVSGLDGASDTAEIETAIRNALPVHEDLKMVVAEPWATYGGGANTAVTLPKTAAIELAKKGSLQVGWTLCRVKEKIELRNCYKCRGYGHTAASCSNVQVKDLCRRCLQHGHQIKGCQNDRKCIDCNREGHSAGTTRCPVFGRLLEEERARRDTQI